MKLDKFVTLGAPAKVRLSSVSLSHVNFNTLSKNLFNRMLQTLSDCHNLKVLILNDVRLGALSRLRLLALVTVLMQCQRLEHLSFRGNQLGNNAFQNSDLLFSVFLALPNLRFLNLRNNQWEQLFDVERHRWSVIFELIPSLERLELSAIEYYHLFFYEQLDSDFMWDNIEEHALEHARENTMSSIIYQTARDSEARLRERFDFPVSTVDSAEENELIQQFTRELLNKKRALEACSASPLPYTHNVEVALRGLRGDYRRKEDLQFTDIRGYGLKNLVALYFKAICVSDITQTFCIGVAYADAITSLCNGIANGVRGNNRNDDDTGRDNGVKQDHPICGRGKYNKLAEEMVSILPDVNLIFDLQEMSLHIAKQAYARILMQYVRGDKITAQSILDTHLESNFEAKRWCLQHFETALQQHFPLQLQHYSKKIASQIEIGLKKLIQDSGGVETFLEYLTLSPEMLHEVAQDLQTGRHRSAKSIQIAWRQFKLAAEKTETDPTSQESLCVRGPALC